MHTDNAPELIKGEFAKLNRRVGTKQTSIEPRRPNQNRAELTMREFKKRLWRLMARVNLPLRLWCYAAEYIADIMCYTAFPLSRLGGRTSYEHVVGHTPDISEYILFEFYEWLWYWNDEVSFPDERKRLGRWLGIAHKVGQGMTFWILQENGTVVARSTVSKLEDDEGSIVSINEKKEHFTKNLHERIGNFRTAIINKDDSDINLEGEDLYRFCIDDKTEDHNGTQEPADDNDHEHHDLNMEGHESIEELDQYIGAQVVLPSQNGESLVLTKVTGRKRDSSGRQIGASHENPILDTRLYEVTYPDGSTSEYSANIIAENIYDQFDDDHNFCYFEEIIGHRTTEEAVTRDNGYIETHSGNKPVITTKGWEINIRWSDNSTSWVNLRDLKDSNPVELAEYAEQHDLIKEPAFNWWARYTLKKRKAIISKIRSRKSKRKMKFGVTIPTTYEEALELDRMNGNDLWQKAIEKEMSNVEVAFKFLEPEGRPPPGYKKITCHVIFDVKFSLERKCRYVAGGHLVDTPPHLTHSSVVGRDSVRIALTYAALNGLSISACDISNAYLNAQTEEKVYFEAGTEWGSKSGRNVVVVRALYGLKGSALAWQRHLFDNLRHDLEYFPSKADNNVWMKKCFKPDGSPYWSYILSYVDDLCCVHLNP